jgi:hypothetical protein
MKKPDTENSPGPKSFDAHLLIKTKKEKKKN